MQVPVAVKVRFSLPFPAHTVTLDMQRKLCKATGDALSKMNNQIVLFEDAVRIREVRAAHGLWQRDVVSLGLKWIEVGSEKPQTGTEIENSGLSAALPQKVEFSQHEIMDEFRLGELSYDSFIKGGDKYFKPDVESLIQDSNFTPGQIMDDTEYKYDIFLSYRQVSTLNLIPLLQMISNCPTDTATSETTDIRQGIGREAIRQDQVCQPIAASVPRQNGDARWRIVYSHLLRRDHAQPHGCAGDKPSYF